MNFTGGFAPVNLYLGQIASLHRIVTVLCRNILIGHILLTTPSGLAAPATVNFRRLHWRRGH